MSVLEGISLVAIVSVLGYCLFKYCNATPQDEIKEAYKKRMEKEFEDSL